MPSVDLFVEIAKKAKLDVGEVEGLESDMNLLADLHDARVEFT